MYTDKHGYKNSLSLDNAQTRLHDNRIIGTQMGADFQDYKYTELTEKL